MSAGFALFKTRVDEVPLSTRLTGYLGDYEVDLVIDDTSAKAAVCRAKVTDVNGQDEKFAVRIFRDNAQNRSSAYKLIRMLPLLRGCPTLLLPIDWSPPLPPPTDIAPESIADRTEASAAELRGRVLFQVFRFCECGDLMNAHTCGVRLPLPLLEQVALDVIGAIAYLHGLGLVHCDLKPEKVGLSAGHGFVSGLVTVCLVDEDAVSTSYTRRYEPREVIECRAVCEKRDIFQLGWVLRFLLSKWNGYAWIDPTWAQKGIARMMSDDPGERPTAEELLAPNSWIRTIASAAGAPSPRKADA
jgi:serine/threonine protein kinase